MGRLDGKVAIITGAGGGMGLEQMKLFAKEGAKVIGVDMTVEPVEKVVEEIKNNNGEALALKLDVSSAEGWQEVVEKTVDTFGKLNVLVNTAGIVGPDEASVVEHDLDELDKILEVNLKGAFIGSKYAIPEMIKTGGGSIVNISSIGGVVGEQGGTGYGTSKAAIIGMTRNIAVEYGPENIRANSILPGQVQTPMSAFLETEEAKEIKQEYIDKTPLGHFGEPIDIANAALFLASDESKYTTGTELYVDGGVTAK